MKSKIAVAALIGVTFAAASASSVLAQSSGPGSTPSKPGKVTAVPPPPPPRGGPDKLTTGTRPPGDDASPRTPNGPKVVDDITAKPRPGAKAKSYKCYANCGVFMTMCDDMGGGLSSTPDGGMLCTVND